MLLYTWHVERIQLAIALEQLESYPVKERQLILTTTDTFFEQMKACAEAGGRLYVPSSEADLLDVVN